MNGENQRITRVAYVRNIRRVAAIVAIVVVISAAYFVYVFGLRAHPHRVGLACIIAGVYLVVFGAVYSFLYRSQIVAGPENVAGPATRYQPSSREQPSPGAPTRPHSDHA